MGFQQFLQNLLERVGLAEPPAPPPHAADVPLADPQQLGPIFPRLALWGLKHLRLIAGAEPEADDLVQAVRRAAQLGMHVSVRGRASDLIRGELLCDLAAAGACEIEIPFLSAIGEVHDALAGAGDYRSALRAMDTLANLRLPLAAQVALVPSTWKTIERTLQLLDDRRLHNVRCFAIACRDEKPSNWAISASELVAAARWIEQFGPSRFNITWYPPLKFDSAQTLAQQVRRGPRAAADAVRIEPDGRVIPPIGPAVVVGNMLRDDWKSIARREVFRALKRRAETARRCDACPGLAGCASGCLREAVNWAEGWAFLT
jgi:radical SAM protein with 4Fe4S-binding SPASM domain